MTNPKSLLDYFGPIAARLGPEEKLDLLLNVSETTAREAIHPAITWPIVPSEIINLLTRKSV